MLINCIEYGSFFAKFGFGAHSDEPWSLQAMEKRSAPCGVFEGALKQTTSVPAGRCEAKRLPVVAPPPEKGK